MLKPLQFAGEIYIGKARRIKSGGFSSGRDEISVTIEVLEYLCGGGKQQLKERVIRGFFPDILYDQLYLIGQKDGHVIALMPLEHGSQLKEAVKELIHKNIIRDIIINAAAQEIVEKIKVKWEKCRLYDTANMPLIEMKSSHYISKSIDVQFIKGCVGKKIEPFIKIQAFAVDGNHATVKGFISPNKQTFLAELSDKQKGASFTIDKVTLEDIN